MFNVLLVDDEPIVKIALRTMIDWDNLGFSICGTASDGNEALVLVKELNPDIIITDLKMPNMNGLQLIRELNELGYKGKIIVASNFGEYELVREALVLGAVDYMLKISIKTEALIEQLQKTAKLLQEEQLILQEQVTREQVLRNNLKSVKNTMLKDYFTNSYHDIEHFLKNEEIQLNFANKACYQFYIHLDDSSLKEGQKFNISLSFIENMILDLMESEHDVEVFQVEINAIIVLIAKERLHQCQFDPLTFVQKIQKLMQMYMTIETAIVYSSEICGYQEARQTYLECKDTIDINFYEEQSVIFNDEVDLKQEIDFVNYVDFSKSILDFLYKDESSSIQLMLKTFTEQAHQSSIHPFALKTFMNKCLDYLPLCDTQITILNAEQYDRNKNNVLECKSSDALLAIAMEALDGLSLWKNAPRSLDSSVTKKEIVDVIRYIELHYRDKITLEMIADHVNFSENYLCRVFRDQMGMSLIHYINNVRMNKAAELIMKGHTYIKEISALVGISDQFYFSRMFKKQFGVSPTDYKSHVTQLSQQKKQTYPQLS
ncbi:response regulator transcription factor [Paenibacillus sp. FJAT-27812]|uniref:response regulator transcription factor n=1 Tax=Paenibacillus sp. FJAT-27812 TaxID=1684143 RepID=UPI0006A75D67|nr:response regulator [Paenibacillus sp. FJAT-27812]